MRPRIYVTAHMYTGQRVVSSRGNTITVHVSEIPTVESLMRRPTIELAREVQVYTAKFRNMHNKQTKIKRFRK